MVVFFFRLLFEDVVIRLWRNFSPETSRFSAASVGALVRGSCEAEKMKSSSSVWVNQASVQRSIPCLLKTVMNNSLFSISV